MKALTIRQPWASLIVLNFKRMETRSWDTKFRGELAIHAGVAMPCRIGETVEFGEFTVERDSKSGLLLRGPIAWPYRLPLGAIVGTVDLFQTRSTNSVEHKPDDQERALGDHSPDRFAWSTSVLMRLAHPRPCKGKLGLWDIPESIAAELVAIP